MKDLHLRARVVSRTSNMKISRRHLADYVKTLHQKACRTCSTIIFLHSTNQIIDLWRCRGRCRRQILNSLTYLRNEIENNQTVNNHTFIEKNHLGDWSPDKDCCLRMAVGQPVRKPSWEQARNQGGCTGCVRTPPQAPKVRILILIIQVKECCRLN